jgi:hypothetical protein
VILQNIFLLVHDSQVRGYENADVAFQRVAKFYLSGVLCTDRCLLLVHPVRQRNPGDRPASALVGRASRVGFNPPI